MCALAHVRRESRAGFSERLVHHQELCLLHLLIFIHIFNPLLHKPSRYWRSIVLSGSACLRFFAAEQTAKIVGDIKQYRHQKQGYAGGKQNAEAD